MTLKKNPSDTLIDRRHAIKIMVGGMASSMLYMSSCKSESFSNKKSIVNSSSTAGQVTTRLDYKSGKMLPLLGFGCMRFPVIQRGKPDIDEEYAMQMIDVAYNSGVNYFDTAWPYHEGLSETFVGKALKKYPRESYFLADKMPTWAVNNIEDAKNIFSQQLEKCQVDYFDYYLLHALNSQSSFEKVYEQIGTLEFLQQMKKEGKIKNLGFSFHGSVEFFEFLLEKYDIWDFVQIQLNYFDWDDARQQSGKLYRMLEEKNIPVIVMEPLRGGMLARLNPTTEKVFKENDPDVSLASWAFRYVATFPNVVCVLSGMSTMEHVIDNINTFTDFKPLDRNELLVVNKALSVFKEVKPEPCTACRYCMPCPYGVDIPGVIDVYNKNLGTFNVPNLNSPRDEEFKRKKRVFLNSYTNHIDHKAKAHRCINCSKCVDLCPQDIDIPKFMRKMDNLVASLKKEA